MEEDCERLLEQGNPLHQENTVNNVSHSLFRPPLSETWEIEMWLNENK